MSPVQVLDGDKRGVAELVVATLEPIRQKYLDLSRDPETLEAMLAEGAERARPLADLTRDRVRQLMGWND
jgi:tryptophanyl-tRNA synthetase